MSSLRLSTLLFAAALAGCRELPNDRAPLLTNGPDAGQPRTVTAEHERWFRGASAADGVRIMPGDRISIMVQDHEDLRVGRVVPPNGDIPVLRANKVADVAHVNALGKTPQDLEKDVAAVHAADIVNPYVTVQIDVAAPRSIYVVGAVKAQGVYAVSGNGRLTVLQALALAGGASDKSDLTGVTIQRIYPPTGETVSSPPLDIKRVIENQDQRDNLVVEPGDTIVVPGREDETVQVLGKVMKPGSYPFRKGMRLSEALADAGSFEKFAKITAIRIVRHGRENIVVNYEDVLNGKIDDPVLESHDAVFIDERWM